MVADNVLKRIVFKKYKALRNFRLDIRSMNVLVGPNNCGKSTVLSALRVLAAGLSKARSRNPEVLDSSKGPSRGYQLANADLPIITGNIHTDLQDTDTSIEFEFQNSTSIEIEFPESGGCMMFARNCDKIPTSVSAFKKAFPFVVDHIPTLGPLDPEERPLEKVTVRRNLNSHRASANFRNYWYHHGKDFALFANKLHETWPSMEIEFPYLDFGSHASAIFMTCKENRMSREVFWAGFGFQVWCQLLTHLIRTRNSDLVVVDEPEIYLHADLQRQLIHILREMGPNFVIATHSSEILSETEPNEVVIIDKESSSGRRIRKAAQVQDALDVLGSGHNLILARIARSKRVCFVEGTDSRMLRMFARTLSKNELASSDQIIFIPIGGFSGWPRIDAYKWAFEQSVGEKMIFGVVLDRDFRSNEEIQEIENQLSDKLNFVHIHKRKEIENYFLVPSVLKRFVDKISGNEDDFLKIIDSLSNEVRSDLMAKYSACHSTYFQKSGIDPVTSITESNKRFESMWNTLETRMNIVSGKKFLSIVNREIQNKHNKTISPSKIINSMKLHEIPEDMVLLINKLEEFRTSAHLKKRMK
ncbi:ATP-dependent nuclease [Rubinisphaera italica]|uniref:Iron-dicitrate transporter ATP-binding subunit n=1 Tax=Rubinisphaera italica TaxID=2527969 RepID=A0A5C5XGN4_9PLAN|nr:ATP-binding protein [Rubinisphaera italica]TWT62326.1 iron-dicitrate transporter ATP-binding subunit [Rubinisphaera italica]